MEDYSAIAMDKLRTVPPGPLTLYIFLVYTGCVHSMRFKFENITCDNVDKDYSTVDYCYVGQVNRQENFINLSFQLQRVVTQNLLFHCSLMIKNNGWKPFLYSFEIDICRFWRVRYNAIAKLFFHFLDQHSNLNHSCPYNEKYVKIVNLTNTHVAKMMPTMPIPKGHYAIFTKWVWRNVTRVKTDIYLEML